MTKKAIEVMQPRTAKTQRKVFLYAEEGERPRQNGTRMRQGQRGQLEDDGFQKGHEFKEDGVEKCITIGSSSERPEKAIYTAEKKIRMSSPPS